MKAVITGGAGFIGSAIAKKLEQQSHDVTVIDDFSAGQDNLSSFQGTIIRESVCNAKAMELALQDANAVFHLGAMNALPECSSNAAKTMEVNVRGTAVLLDAARKVAGANFRFVFTSSSAVYEGSKKLPNNEDDPSHPFLAYAISKLQGELLCKSFHKSFGLPFSIIRPFNVYGEGQDFKRAHPPVVSAFIVPLLKGKRATIYGDGAQSRDFIHVDDVADLFITVAKEKQAAAQTFNAGTQTSTSINDLYASICRLLSIERDPVYAPAQGLFHAYPEIKKGTYPFRDEIIEKESLKKTCADMSKAKDLLDWKPKISLGEGIQRSIDYIKENI